MVEGRWWGLQTLHQLAAYPEHIPRSWFKAHLPDTYPRQRQCVLASDLIYAI